MISQLLEIAQRAGDAIMSIYLQPFTVEQKTDQSPLTAADIASNKIILDGLAQHFPHIPAISEESQLTDYSSRQTWRECWLIDPLDGTKEFIKRNGEFTVNIALIRDGIPVLGVIYVPAQQTMYYAEQGKGSYKIENGVTTRLYVKKINPLQPVYIVASRSHLNAATEEYIAAQKQRFNQVALVSAGSSLKFCLLAEGRAHLYPRFAPTMEWDTAAGHIIATEAGATVQQIDGSDLFYNKKNLLNPYFITKVDETSQGG